jgi:hypothetical protein
MILALVCILVALAGLGFALWRARQLRRDVRRVLVLAAMAAEAPCEALSHVRLVPPDDDLGGAGTPDADSAGMDGLGKALPGSTSELDDDIYVRVMKALNIFAEDNGYDVPLPTIWIAIASVTATAILGEDLAAVLAGPGEGRDA